MQQLSFDFGALPELAAPPSTPPPPSGLASAPPVKVRRKTPAASAPALPVAGAGAGPESAAVPANFLELEARLKAMPEDTRKNADMRSAARTVGKVLALQLQQVPTDPAQLGPMLDGACPMAAGVTKARWNRVKSLTLSALAATGSEVLPGRDLQGYSPLWKALHDQLPDKRSKVGLSRLFSFFSRKGINPKDVTAEHLEAFGEVLKARNLRSNPVQTYRSTIRIWNAVSASVPGWPKVTVKLEPDRRRYALPPDAFPASFWADVGQFHQNSSDPDPFSDTYSPPVRPSTVKARHKQIHQVASALVATGFPIERLTSLKVLIQPSNAKAALRHLLDRRDGKTGKHLEGQARLLRTIARHWVRDNDAADALARMSKGLHVKSEGMTPRNRERLRQFDLPENVDALINLPLRVFAEQRSLKAPTEHQARRAMLGLAVELLLMAPIRVGNLTATEMGTNLLQVRRGKHRRYHLVFLPSEVKNSEPYEAELPLASMTILEDYLARYRPVLGDTSSVRLFLGGKAEDGGRSRTPFSRALSEFIFAETGLRMHAHLFRHFAGHFYLARYPDDIETMRRVLGHRSTATTLRSYAVFQTDDAHRRYDALLDAQRAGASKSGAGKAGKAGKGGRR